MRIDDFDYQLPDDLIASHPGPRGASRLLLLKADGTLHHRWIRDLPSLMRPGDLMVVNDTRVLHARLYAHRHASGGRVEILLVRKRRSRIWDALARPARRLRAGERIDFEGGLQAEVLTRNEEGGVTLHFSADVEERLDEIGHVPLPPYIRRPDTLGDRERYQTVYASRPGAIAAPTAGLHFDRELLHRLDAAGIERAELTLHVGPATFQPISVGELEDHRMGEERYDLPESTCRAVAETRRRGGRILAVGTTVVRALESSADARGDLRPGAATTDLFIRPGFRFRVVDLLVTNFHLPRSTLLVLVSAFAGRDRILGAYRRAIERRYRFYSYGDAMLLEPPKVDPAADRRR